MSEKHCAVRLTSRFVCLCGSAEVGGTALVLRLIPCRMAAPVGIPLDGLPLSDDIERFVVGVSGAAPVVLCPPVVIDTSTKTELCPTSGQCLGRTCRWPRT